MSPSPARAMRATKQLRPPPQPPWAPSTRQQWTRRNATYEPPSRPPGPNAHRTFWMSFGRPIAKVFLGAMATYQLAYIAWLKLETVEEQHDKDAQVRDLQMELADLVGGKGRAAEARK